MNENANENGKVNENENVNGNVNKNGNGNGNENKNVSGSVNENVNENENVKGNKNMQIALLVQICKNGTIHKGPSASERSHMCNNLSHAQNNIDPRV